MDDIDGGGGDNDNDWEVDEKDNDEEVGYKGGGWDTLQNYRERGYRKWEKRIKRCIKIA